LYGHPAVSDVQVIGVPDERYGEELCAWIVVRAGQTLTEDEVREHCRASLAHYKVPRYVMFVDGFPMTVTGKVQKFEMRKTSVQQLGLHAAAGVRTA
jgi:fatty-acyl-CoA synthase